jgi:hypothetical protein
MVLGDTTTTATTIARRASAFTDRDSASALVQPIGNNANSRGFVQA